MAEIERTYIIPLRREFLKVPKYRRAKRTIAGIRTFLKKHMKSEQVKLGMQLNEYVWERGMQSPPHKVKVTVKKDDKGVVYAELFGVKGKEKREQKNKKKTEEEKGKPETKAPDQKKDDKKQKQAEDDKKK